MNSQNNTPSSQNWHEYYDITRDQPPHSLLIKALGYVKNKKKAIDIGGGALKDTRYLLREGFDVTVIDEEPLLLKEVESLHSDRLHAYVTSFEDYNFDTNEFDIASAIYSLPFNRPSSFVEVFNKIKKSLVKDGIFCGQFFGVNDEWFPDDGITFHTKAKLEDLLSDMEIIYLDEEDRDGTTAKGTPKHRHIFHIIARR